MSVRAYLGLGSNLGDRGEYLAQAVRALREAGRRSAHGSAPCLTVDAVSPLYETAPIGTGGSSEGVAGQPPYLNCAVALTTHLEPLELLWLTAGVEAALGRVRLQHWGPRTVDIDLILFGDQRIAHPDLTVPHPRAHERRFVLQPLADLAPDLLWPDGRRLSDMLPLVISQRIVRTPTEIYTDYAD